MSKINDLKEAARQQARAPAEVKAIVEGLDSVKAEISSIHDLPALMSQDLQPLRQEVDRLRATITETIQATPAALASQLEPVRQEAALLAKRVDALPDTIAELMSPAKDLAEQLDAILSVQRSTLHEMSEEFTREAMGHVQEQTERLGQTARRLEEAPERSEKASEAMMNAASSMRQTERELTDKVKQMSGFSWKTAVIMGIVFAGLTIGAQLWLSGILDSNVQAQLAEAQRENQMWRQMYSEMPQSQRRLIDEWWNQRAQ